MLTPYVCVMSFSPRLKKFFPETTPALLTTTWRNGRRPGVGHPVIGEWLALMEADKQRMGLSPTIWRREPKRQRLQIDCVLIHSLPLVLVKRQAKSLMELPGSVDALVCGIPFGRAAIAPAHHDRVDFVDFGSFNVVDSITDHDAALGC